MACLPKGTEQIITVGRDALLKVSEKRRLLFNLKELTLDKAQGRARCYTSTD